MTEMPWGEGFFRDRTEAGRRLAVRLLHYGAASPVVLAIPRGGIVVGAEVARALGAPLDVIPARKLSAIHPAELAVGAVAPNARVLDWPLIHALEIAQDEICSTVATAEEEVERVARLYHSLLWPTCLDGRTVILVDNGMASGFTVCAAALSVRQRRPRRIIAALPVCASSSAERIRREVDELIAIVEPTDLYSAEFWYRDFHSVTEEEAVDCLAASVAKLPGLGIAA